MSDSQEEFPELSKISTLCPICDELCTWYRLPTLLYGVCPNHGRVEQIQIPVLPDQTVDETTD